MPHSWIDPVAILSVLEAETTPATQEEGRALVQRGAVGGLREAEVGEGAEVRAGVEDRGLRHRVSLAVTATRVEGRCDCAGERWPCAHVLALARAWAEGTAAAELSAGGRGSGWRELLGALAPRLRPPPRAVASQVLVHWVDMREAGGGEWELLMSWRLHRESARGLGRGRVLPLAVLLRTPPEGTTPADLAAARTAAEGAGPGAGLPGGGPVALRGARATALLVALARAPRVRWTVSRGLVGFEWKPACVRLVAAARDGGLALSARWAWPDTSPWEPTGARVVGSSPPWVEAEGVFRPVLGAEDGRALVRLLAAPVTVPEADLPSFLGGTVPDLEARGMSVDVRGLGERRFQVLQVPRPRLYLSEEAGALVGWLRFAYGDYEVEAGVAEAVLAVGTGELKAYVRRDMEAEFGAVLKLRQLGFAAVEPGRFELEGDRALDFVARDLEPLAADWEVLGRDDLRRYRVSTDSVRVKIRVTAGIDWLDLDLETEARGDELDPQEVVRALQKGGRYVRLGSGAHAALPQEWLGRLATALGDLGLRGGRARLGLHLAPLVDELLDLAPDSEVVGLEAWGRLLEALGGRSEPPASPLPAGFVGGLRPYQERGYRWLRFMASLGLGCVLADDMGLGKTIQALATLLAEQEAGGRGPSLVVAPTSVVANWEAEARRFTPSLRVLRYYGADRRDAGGDFADYDLVVTSYALLRRDVGLLSVVPWNYVILDEAQAIKNAATQTARAARKLGARHRLALTGTPLENHLGDLWSQFHFLAPGLLGSERRFGRQFVRPIAQGDTAARELLARRIRPFLLRRLKSEVAQDLPPKVEAVALCEMGPEQDALYRSLLLASREKVLGAVGRRGLVSARVSVLEALLRLRQACCLPEVLPGGLGQGVPSAKFELFREFVSEVIDEGHRVLVFSQFVQVLTVLRRWFEAEGISHLYLDGHTRDREERVRRFQEDESVKAFLVSLKAGGTGLNLTGADYVVLFDPWWNPAVETQAADRAHRIGQTRQVFAYKLITKGTVEEKILALQERKRALTRDLVTPGEDWIGGLTEDDLESLFALE